MGLGREWLGGADRGQAFAVPGVDHLEVEGVLSLPFVIVEQHDGDEGEAGRGREGRRPDDLDVRAQDVELPVLRVGAVTQECKLRPAVGAWLLPVSKAGWTP